MSALLSFFTSPHTAPSFAAAAAASVLMLPLARKRNARGRRLSPMEAHLNPNFTNEPPEKCRLCDGEGLQLCTVCNARGTLNRSSFNRHNSVRVPALVGSKWTSLRPIDGKWRHFQCTAKRGNTVKDTVALLSSTCGPVENRISIEVPVKELKSRQMWEGGWTTLQDIRHGSSVGIRTCATCNGNGKIPCPRCDGLGRIGL